jgi:uncharacterized protein YbaR (Trm112 family)/SAM-dependent methyltransferase
MDIFEQVSRGIIVCPETKQKLSVDTENNMLTTHDRKYQYKLLQSNVPILLKDSTFTDNYIKKSSMLSEYECFPLSEKSIGSIVRKKLSSDYRSTASVEAFNKLFTNSKHNGDAIILSIGGGPTRPYDRMINLNIGPFQNVDIVADAHLLPYADNSVDAIYCEAVIEHLYDPTKAAAEMYRVLKQGCEVFAVTPFLQAYHGYPHHYQNYTLTGHVNLFTSAGFNITESGTCVGPMYTIYSIISSFLNNYLPAFIAFPMRIIWFLTGILFRPLDIILNKKEISYILASTTYLVAQK